MRIWTTTTADRGGIVGYTVCVAGRPNRFFEDVVQEVANKLGFGRDGNRLADRALVEAMAGYSQRLRVSAEIEGVTLGELLRRLAASLTGELDQDFTVRTAAMCVLRHERGEGVTAYFPISVRPRAVAHHWPPEPDGEELVRFLTGTPRGAQLPCY